VARRRGGHKNFAEVFRTGSSVEKAALSRNLGDIRNVAVSLFDVKPESVTIPLDENGVPVLGVEKSGNRHSEK